MCVLFPSSSSFFCGGSDRKPLSRKILILPLVELSFGIAIMIFGAVVSADLHTVSWRGIVPLIAGLALIGVSVFRLASIYRWHTSNSTSTRLL